MHLPRTPPPIPSWVTRLPDSGGLITNLEFQFGTKVADPRHLVAIVSRKGRIRIAIYDNFVALCKPMGAHLGLKLGVS